MNRMMVAPLAFCALTLAPSGAFACGGFFCSTSPIEQAGETIVYGLEEDGTLTMAIQIQYAGDDDDFAWILPVMAPPELSIGADALFDELRRVTEPTFVVDEVREGVCRSRPVCVSESTCATHYDYSGCGGGGPASDPWTGGFVDAGPRRDASLSPRVDAGPPEEGVMVFSEGPIGPYESVVLGATTAREVVDWLQENEYDVPESSVPLLESYAAAGQIFVALRLRSNAATRVIQPIVLRMPTSEVCLPIRLTSIATVPGLPITAFFLGRDAVTSTNYSMLDIDTSDLGFWSGTRAWRSEVLQGVREMDGQAFSRDYSGATPAIEIELPPVDDLAEQTDVALFIQALALRGYRGEPRLFDLFETYIVPPAAAESSTAYFNCLASRSTVACGEPATFDALRLAAAIDAQITRPRAEAQALVHRHNHLTRLFTMMNAEDMTLDPVFIADSGMPDVDNVHTARRVTECSYDYYTEDAPQHWDFGGERTEIRAGSFADDSGYCRSRGLVLRSEASSCPSSSSSSSSTSSGGCLSVVASPGSMQGGVIAGFALLFVARRRWRRR